MDRFFIPSKNPGKKPASSASLFLKGVVTTSFRFVTLWVMLILLKSCLSYWSQQETPSKQQKSEDEDELNSAEESSTGTTEGEGPRLPFPQKPTRHSTRVMLLAQPQPIASQINACREQVQSIGLNAQSQEEMAIARKQLVPLVEADTIIYHFCFFQLMAELDQKLLEGGSVMTQQAPVFLDTMRSLWIVASALDTVSDTERYFNYLKKRYMELSASIFGRTLETIGPPMGNIQFDPDSTEAPAPSVTKPGKKDAGAASSN